MKNRSTTALLCVLAGCLVSHLPALGQKTYPVVWEITEGLKAPESAYLDEDSGALFLSQIGEGGGMAKDGDGWISKLTLEGKMVKNKWATGFNAPKGLRSHGGTLWVADIDRVVAVSIKTGKVTREVPIAGAKFLNDVACGSDGAVYVSDMVASRIYKVVDGKATVLAEGEAIEHPNGLLVQKKKLILGCWGGDFQPDFSTKIPGNLMSLHLKSGKTKVLTKQRTGNLDGVEADGKGGYIVTDWRAGKVFRITRRGASELLMTLPRGTADHAFIADRRLLILPQMLENKLTAFDLSD